MGDLLGLIPPPWGRANSAESRAGWGWCRLPERRLLRRDPRPGSKLRFDSALPQGERIGQRDTHERFYATSRRALLAGTIAATLPLPHPAAAADVDAAELLKPGPLPDIWLGPADAKVAIVEYASLTCGHCGRFHRRTWKELKARWVDPARIRFTLRPFPLDPLSTLAFMAARSEPPRYYELTDLLFETQDSWAYVAQPLPALRQMLLTAGFTQESFDKLLRNQSLLDAVNGVKTRGAEVFGVEATPTFFINGQRRQGAISIDEFESIIRPILGL